MVHLCEAVGLHIRGRVEAFADLELLRALDEAVHPVLRLADRDHWVPYPRSARSARVKNRSHLRVESAMQR